MATLSMLLLVWYSVCGLTSAAAVDSFTIASRREAVDAGILHRKRQTASLPSVLDKSLYWFANFTIGDAKDVYLLIDTGSTDLLMEPGVYEP